MDDIRAYSPCCAACSRAGRNTYRARIDFHDAEAAKYSQRSKWLVIATGFFACVSMAALVLSAVIR